MNDIGKLLKTIKETFNRGLGGKTDLISLTPTITGGAYVAGDTVGGMLVFTDILKGQNRTGVTLSMIIIDDAGQDAELELWLFDRTFTAIADNAPFNPSEGDLENSLGVISTSDGTYYSTQDGNRSQCIVKNIGLVSKGVGNTIYGQLMTRGTPTYSATDDLSIKLGELQD